MSDQDRTESPAAEQRRAEHLKALAAPGSNYAFGYLNYLVRAFVDGEIGVEYLRKAHAELADDLKAAEK